MHVPSLESNSNEAKKLVRNLSIALSMLVYTTLMGCKKAAKTPQSEDEPISEITSLASIYPSTLAPISDYRDGTTYYFSFGHKKGQTAIRIESQE